MISNLAAMLFLTIAPMTPVDGLSESLKESELPQTIEIGAPAPEIRTPLSEIKPVELAQETALAPMPEPVPEPVVQKVNSTTYSYTPSAQNWYTPGNCTWYVKSLRPDIPNSLGNADTWTVRAAALGMATGSEPRVGAVGQSFEGGGHVVYVTGIDGPLMHITEMNYKGLYIVSERTTPWSGWNFIY